MDKAPEIIWYDCLDSTNNEARRRFRDLDNLSVIAAMTQISGRGQGDHIWYSSPGESLTFSYILKFDGVFPAGKAEAVSHITTLAILDYLEDKGIRARIKWPNDIWISDRKICGILVENFIEGDFLKGSIVGVGLNLSITQWPEDIPNPVSLSQLAEGEYRPEEELPLLYEKICRRRIQADSDEGRISMQEEFGKNMFKLPSAQ